MTQFSPGRKWPLVIFHWFCLYSIFRGQNNSAASGALYVQISSHFNKYKCIKMNRSVSEICIPESNYSSQILTKKNLCERKRCSILYYSVCNVAKIKIQTVVKLNKNIMKFRLIYDIILTHLYWNVYLHIEP